MAFALEDYLNPFATDTAPPQQTPTDTGGGSSGSGGGDTGPAGSDGGGGISIPGGINWTDIFQRGGITGKTPAGSGAGTDPFNNQTTQGSTTRSNSNLYGNKQAFRDALLGSGGRTVSDLKNFVAQHPEYGVTIGGTKGDKVYFNGQFWADVVKSAGIDGGQGFYWNEDTGDGGGGGGTNYGSMGGAEFSDPWAALFEKLVGGRLDSLSQDPNRELLDRYLARLDEADANNKKNVDEFVASLRSRVSDLQKPPYTAGEEAVLRAKAFDQLERRRQETLKNAREGVYARGFAPTSGLVNEEENQVNNRFEGARTTIESDLLQSAIQEAQDRADKATQLEALIEQALNGGDLTGLQFLGSQANIEDQLNQERQQREREILSTAALPLDLEMSRAQLANQTLGLGGNPQSLMNSILGLLSFGNQNRQLNVSQQANNFAGLGSLLSVLFPSR